MAIIRFRALQEIQGRKPVDVIPPSTKISDFFGENVFGKDAMRNTLATDIFRELTRTIDKGGKIESNVANAVAAAMKSWDMVKGATHYTHWFQPLTGSTAEKHEIGRASCRERTKRQERN